MVGVKSPLRSLTWEKANRRRKLVLTPVCINHECPLYRAGVIQSSNWPHARAIWACRAAFRGRRLLLLVDLRSGLGDAAFYKISLNLELLLRAQVHHGV